MEDELDAVSRGEEEWTTPLEKFWKPFIHQVEKIEKNVTREQVAMARELGKDPVTGRPVSVRMGRYGPFVQSGTKDDEEKPRFAGLKPGQKMDHVTLADAMELFKLPRTLGETLAGETIVANVGRFGPYVKYGSKYASLKEDDPYTITLERAREVIRLKQEADAARLIQDFPEAGLQVLNGRYGPYITDKKKNAKIPKERDPKTLTLEECRALLAAAPEARRPLSAAGGARKPPWHRPQRRRRQGRRPTPQGRSQAQGQWRQGRARRGRGWHARRRCAREGGRGREARRRQTRRAAHAGPQDARQEHAQDRRGQDPQRRRRGERAGTAAEVAGAPSARPRRSR